MTVSVILKTDRRGVLSLVPVAPGMTHGKAEAEASRLRFKDEAKVNYCVYTGIFTIKQAEAFVAARNAGHSIPDSMRAAVPGWRSTV